MMAKFYLVLAFIVTLVHVISAKSITQDFQAEKLTGFNSRKEYSKYLLWGHVFASNKHNLILGNKQPGDWLLNEKVIDKSKSWIPFVRVSDSYNYSVQKPGYITCVEVLDQATNGMGGYATLLSGGPGYRNVSFSFESQRSEGLNFIVNVYGKPPNY